MTDRLLAAIARKAERIAAGVDVAADDRRYCRHRRASHWLRQSRRERAGRWRERLGRVRHSREET
jgi:hypothetical protein